MPDDDALRVFAAIPAGHRRADSTAAWMTTVQAHPAVAALRADAREALLGLCWALTGYTDRRSMTARPGWDDQPDGLR